MMTRFGKGSGGRPGPARTEGAGEKKRGAALALEKAYDAFSEGAGIVHGSQFPWNSDGEIHWGAAEVLALSDEMGGDPSEVEDKLESAAEGLGEAEEKLGELERAVRLMRTGVDMAKRALGDARREAR